MGGGGDSRIPSILSENINNYVDSGVHIDVIVRTYDIDPDIAWRQISSWFDELHPQLVIGESLGALHAIRIRGVPHIFVSPAIGASRWMSFASHIPGSAKFMKIFFKPRPGDRQSLDFTQKILSHYRGIRRQVFNCASDGDYFFAFFGTDDSYRRWGVVSVTNWERHFGKNSYKIYKGTHFMEEEYLYSMLIPKILSILGISAG